ncbi:NADPH-dependent FMN reductase [Asticcacaulis solisilvae]|uniref:NADPH-dependent FMN reductase n=1 Tax=Asticcacaulis solisilvae TaxID=1217274 RepID=UPI003FD8891F
MKNIVVLVGSLRKDSINKTYTHALEKLATGQFAFHYADMDLPLYNDDLWQSPPAKVVALKEAIAKADGILIVSPEYNRSIPAVTKNAIDWASRPYGQNAWKGKAVAITGASTGSQGTAVMQSQLRSSLVILGTAVLGDPEVYITFKPEMLDADGAFANEGTVKFLKGFLDNFDAWIDRVK